MMSKRSKVAQLPIPAAARKLFDHFRVANGPHAPAYEAFLAEVVETLAPKNIVESIFVKDFADHAWEAMRLRKVEVSLLMPEDLSAQTPALDNFIDEQLAWLETPIEVQFQRPLNNKERTRLEREFAMNHPLEYAAHLRRLEEGPKKLADLIASYGGPVGTDPPYKKPKISGAETDRASVVAYKKHSREVDLISRRIALAESSRNAALRELERYRAARPARTEVIVDAEYQECPAGQSSGSK
jgi:hypothetical protein